MGNRESRAIYKGLVDSRAHVLGCDGKVQVIVVVLGEDNMVHV